MNNRDVLEQVDRGYRMPKPTHVDCPNTIYQVMLDCWDKDPEKRPTFEYLYSSLFLMSRDIKMQKKSHVINLKITLFYNHSLIQKFNLGKNFLKTHKILSFHLNSMILSIIKLILSTVFLKYLP
jgi:hypothetical protein